MAVDVEKVITDKAEETRAQFRALLDKTNKEHPHPKDVKALAATESWNYGETLRVLVILQRLWCLRMRTQQQRLKSVGSIDFKR